MFRSIIGGAAAFAVLAVAPAAAAPKPRSAKPPATIEISNQRQAALTGFEIVAAGENGRTVAKLSKPVPAGKKARVALKGAKGCEYVARWKFEDAGDEADVNLCNDPKIVLTD